jgi:hypothetical protein
MIARVFPSRTSATPTDPLAFVGLPPAEIPSGISEVHVSVTFSWDIPETARLVAAWSNVAPTIVGGPALGDRGGEFVPGRYVREGYVITSRGCPNKCWFCDVHRREGDIRELPVVDGWNLLDSNLLACSPEHQERVFEMLARQVRRPEFTGGIEAKRMTSAIARRLKQIRANRLFCAYDTPDDLPPLIEAGRMLQEAGLTRTHHLHCYVLCGFPRDTIEAAEARMRQAWDAGFHPMAMRWRDPHAADWQKFARVYARPAITRRVLTTQVKR